MQFIVFLIIGGIAGALAGRVVSGHGYGVFMDIVVGVIGAFIGGWLLSTVLGVSGGGVLISFIAAFAGAGIPLSVARPVTGHSARASTQTGHRESGRPAPAKCLTRRASGA